MNAQKTFFLVTMALLSACHFAEEAPVEVDPTPVPSSSVTVASIRGANHLGENLNIALATVISPPSRDGSWMVVQDPQYGHGLAVQRSGVVQDWPFDVGELVRLRGRLGGTVEAPRLIVTTADGIQRTGRRATPLVYADPSSPLVWTLVRWHAVRVRGEPDPTGRATTSLSRDLDTIFGAPAPAWGAEGDLTGIVLPDGAIAPRRASDWTGRFAPGPVVDLTIQDMLRGAVPVGASVQFLGVQVAPWSRDGRWTVVQDPSGVGVWIDTEGWDVPLNSKINDLVSWTGQISLRNGFPFVRVWTPYTIVRGTRGQVVDNEAHGSLIVREISGIKAKNELGAYLTDGPYLLDDRFLSLETLPDPARVLGVLDRSLGPPLLAVFAAEPLEPPIDTGLAPEPP